MTKNFIGTVFLAAICTALLLFCFTIIASAQGDSARPAHIGLMYPLSTNGLEAPRQRNNFSLHALVGVSRSENAFCLSGISSLVKQDVQGVLISGIFNHVGGQTRGLQLAGVLNQTKQDAHGLQLAGLVNIAGNLDGIQLAGLTNIANNANGLQMAGCSNHTKKAGIQIAGFANTADSAKGIQIAGFINIARDAGNQLSGFMNVAKKVSGVQVAGFINIADESDYPIGLVNIVKNGAQQIGLSLDETGSTVLSFRSGGKVLYGILGAGYNFKNDNARYVLEGGLGGHLPIAGSFRANVELTTSAMSDLRNDVYFKTTTRLLAAYKFANRIELFAGPTCNHLGFERFQTDIRNDHYLWSKRNPNYFNGFYIGVMGGIQINI